MFAISPTSFVFIRRTLVAGMLAVSVAGTTACESETSPGQASVHPEPVAGEQAAGDATPAVPAEAAAAASPSEPGANAPQAPQKADAGPKACPEGVAVGSSFKLDCNTCKCTAEGVSGCTYINCEALRKAKTMCDGGRRVGESWTEACNTCRCSDEGQMQCTLKHCGDDAPRFCRGGRSPGDTWKRDCNECSCGEDFTISCTEKACG